MEKKKIGVISLGCDKNRIDTEKMLAILNEKYEITSNIDNANVLIINTCAFLKNSRKESIDEILKAGELKKSNKLEKIIVTGCLPQKFINDIFNSLPEVDAFMGVSDYKLINDIIEKIYNGERVNAVGIPSCECGTRRILSTTNYAYLKIADGCDNHCTYCLIPKIRGKYRSVPIKDLIDEASSLGNLNELILVAQDTTAYGKDLEPKTNLTVLIRELSKLKNIKGIRLLYCYPENITDELIHEFSCNAKMIRYIDIPLQHADDKILKLMNRKGTREEYINLINKLRNNIPNIAIRSTFIAGFPQEDEQAFNNLKNFLIETKLDNVGFFAYSQEEDTPSAKLTGQIKQSVKTLRVKKLYSLQKKIVKEKNKLLIGKSFSVVAEGYDENALIYFGRSYMQAPDVDGKIYFFSKEEIKTGNSYMVKILKIDGLDLYGERI